MPLPNTPFVYDWILSGKKVGCIVLTTATNKIRAKKIKYEQQFKQQNNNNDNKNSINKNKYNNSSNS